MKTLSERLVAMTGRSTLYELAISKDDRKYLVAYCQRNNRRSLWAAVRNEKRVAAIMSLTGASTIDFAKKSADGATMGCWMIRFTGRTQRDAIGQGELTYVCDLPESNH